MISLKTSLKKLYNKVTGKKTKKESISEIIDELQNNYNGASAEYVDEKISEAIASVYTFKGSVDSYSLLPSTGQKIGDVYNVLDSGINYAWDGEAWDDLGGFVIANPTLAGTEDNLAGLQVGDTKYAMPHLYRHDITIKANEGYATLTIYNNVATAFTQQLLFDYIETLPNKYINASGICNESDFSVDDTNYYSAIIVGLCNDGISLEDLCFCYVRMSDIFNKNTSYDITSLPSISTNVIDNVIQIF